MTYDSGGDISAYKLGTHDRTTCNSYMVNNNNDTYLGYLELMTMAAISVSRNWELMIQPNVTVTW